jgi:hypothetical protein
MDFIFRVDAMNARNAFQQEKGPEQTQQYGFNLSGTLFRNRTSFSLSAGGTSLYDSANILAALPDGSLSSSYLKRPSDRINFSGRIDHALSRSHTLRGWFQQTGYDPQNLGVGGFELADRAFARSSTESRYSGVMTSPFFGQPTAALPGRRIDLGMRVAF